ncbi:1,3-beta-galactosyl-N-acetylhexosamine phosphorylase [Vagococcus sp. BWB3-3]|uniref:1,3-beta-galactosyl-N-acetylhexosamine phosphorylase n=1 Tax=Vagococcus allomyrinae TaxID=2794353 RepID=A0A940SRC0_9ENTE|nr:1,3-beta-galactosyl-N-acetylhexosamine phosphorylase [Vagococcus allomyrinae]MBP1040647.1 1,3-beta-galactosyl-N-acetylhexosamine phosphorylase [Vagococcus allomyrinae]
MSKSHGRVTLPSESHFLDETKEIMTRWGADALRDSDGTKLDEALKKLEAKIYTTYFVARNHNQFAEQHLDECQQLYLMSPYQMATGERLTIRFMEGYFDQQIKPDYRHDVTRFWEVIDRTTNQVVSSENWQLNQQENTLTIENCQPWHEYTVSFLADAIWDPTQMYNHITNDWGEVPHDIPFDVRKPHSQAFMTDYLRQWLKDNPDTDVVRFTTFFYHFTLVFNDLGKEKFVDWFGYGASVSAEAIEAFELEYGYRLRPETFIDEGYYNSTFRVPTPEYQDYLRFIQRFVSQMAKKLVDIVHDSGKEAMMFLGDNWIGTEPYGPYFGEIGLDAVVGSVGGGTTLRMISEIPHVKYTEGRFLPYFFPDTFYEGNDPVVEANQNWLSARRAILRKPVDRIGYGGYLSLAYQFPKFIDYVEHVTDEFRDIYQKIATVSPYNGLTVGVLNAWGSLRSWQAYMVAHALEYKQIYSYLGMMESLSGAAVKVVFLSFDELLTNGVPAEVDVLINGGDAHTAFSGGDYWLKPELVTVIRQWIAEGGGFVGLGEPTAAHHGGHYFQLATALGVDKELGFSLSTDKYFTEPLSDHFITADVTRFDFGESMKNIYALTEATEIIEYSDGEIHLAANQFGKGRTVYLAGLPYSLENTRLLLRALYYAATKEAELTKWFSANLHCEVHAYPALGQYAIVNNTNQPQQTEVYNGQGASHQVFLNPSEIKWEVITNE